MSNEEIVRDWRKGLRKETIAKEYMNTENKRRKRTGEKKLTKTEALAHVEPIIFKYQVDLMRGVKDGDNNRGIIKTNA